MSLLQQFVDLNVLVITMDGRVLVGNLRGTDQSANVILSNCEERVFSVDGTEIIKLGLYIIRGDSVCTVGELDEEKEGDIEWSQVRAEPLTATHL
ncbi:Sm-like ribonucleoprotein [Fennellomyces sp. T-0311]|nr:Sm-like ribonucleoprotein [Fennellomyces sp. T-0311]